MKPSMTFLALFTVAIYGIVAGCGTTGGTSQFVLQIDQSSTSPLKSRVDFGSFKLAPEGNVVISPGTYHWGAFTKADEKNFKGSLIDTLNTVRWPSVEDPSSVWQVHIILRRHAVAHDNKSGSVLAAVSWALASKAGKIVHQEQFYASSSAFLVGTIGGMKEVVFKAIVRRVVETSQLLASSQSLPSPIKNTYNTIHEASTKLPESFKNWPILWMVGGQIPVILVATEHAIVDWEMMDPKEPVNWGKQIQLNR